MFELQGQDLASGNLTAPVLFALQSQCGDELLDLIDSEFVEEGDLQRAIELVRAGGGVASAKQLACDEADKVCRLLFAVRGVCTESELNVQQPCTLVRHVHVLLVVLSHLTLWCAIEELHALCAAQSEVFVVYITCRQCTHHC